MDEIKLRISNLTNDTYKSIVLRKFFYMIFIDANGRKLYMYIASVFGGNTEEQTDPQKAYTSIKHHKTTPCSLDFELITNKSEEESVIENVRVINLTSSFCGQDKEISKVWGSCTPLVDEKAAIAALKEYYPNLYPSGKDPAVDITKKHFSINQRGRQSHKCIVREGDFQDLSDPEKNYYTYRLSCPASSPDGLEAMNWVKIDVNLASSILNKAVQFSVELAKGTFYTPDFTWYFAPPTGHIVSADSYLRIGDKQDKNVIQSVSDETTVYFAEWASAPEAIDERIKSRVLLKSIQDIRIEKLSEAGILTVSLHLNNPQGTSNRQFFAGLLVAFLLAFCSDKTRINDYYNCLLGACSCVPTECICQTVCNALTIAVPILLLLSFLSFILSPGRVFPTSHGSTRWYNMPLKVLRHIGLAAISLLVVYVYFLWLLLPAFMSSHIGCTMNNWILVVGGAIALIANLIYLVYCLIVLKRKIYNYL